MKRTSYGTASCATCGREFERRGTRHRFCRAEDCDSAPRSRPNREVGHKCFYCGRVLLPGRFERDHFPRPWRHGGRRAVPVCLECHTLKDRIPVLDDEHFLAAVEEGWKPLAGVYVRSGERVPFIVALLWERIQAAERFGVDDEWDDPGPVVEDQIVRCTTAEARIWIARLFVLYLEVLAENAPAETPIPAA